MKTISVISMLFLVATIGYFSVFPNQRKCSDEQLNVVIDKVKSCKKKNVICPEKEIDRLIKEICGK